MEFSSLENMKPRRYVKTLKQALRYVLPIAFTQRRHDEQHLILAPRQPKDYHMLMTPTFIARKPLTLGRDDTQVGWKGHATSGPEGFR